MTSKVTITYQSIECAECDEHLCKVCGKKATRFASLPGGLDLVEVCHKDHPVEDIFNVFARNQEKSEPECDCGNQDGRDGLWHTNACAWGKWDAARGG